MQRYSLYPRLVVSVGIEFIDPRDIEVLEKLSKSKDISSTQHQDEISREFLLYPQVYALGDRGYLVNNTGADYSFEVQAQILLNWRNLGMGEGFLDIIRSSQLGFVPRIIFEKGGMYPEKVNPPQIGDIGKKALSKKAVRKLLSSLKMAHQHYWPIDMLANIVEPYAKKTRK
jgi:hypothetical protein